MTSKDNSKSFLRIYAKLSQKKNDVGLIKLSKNSLITSFEGKEFFPLNMSCSEQLEREESNSKVDIEVLFGYI